MKLSTTFAIIALISLTGGLLSCATEGRQDNSHSSEMANVKRPRAVAQPPKQRPVPAFMKPDETAALKPTLPPEKFRGTVRAAYQAVREIPKTIAQLPCFCRCDRSAGHKSLHSCFVDEHGANCSICTISALKAHKLEKEQGLSPEQIRDVLIAEYAGY